MPASPTIRIDVSLRFRHVELSIGVQRPHPSLSNVAAISFSKQAIDLSDPLSRISEQGA